MRVIDRLVKWYGKRTVYGVGGLIVFLILLGLGFMLFKGGDTPTEDAAALKHVTIKEAGTLQSENAGIRTVGTVRSVSEARLETESGGRVTRVNVALGDTVRAGAVIASLENAREYASVLQAEGSYEAALVANSQASINLEETEVAAVNAYRTSFTTADNVIRNLADELFTNPDSQNPGLRISGQGRAVELSQEFLTIRNILDRWNVRVQAGSKGDPLELLNDAERDVTRVSDFTSTLAFLLSEEDPNDVFTTEVISAYKTRFLAARTSLDSELQSVSRARVALQSDRKAATNGSGQTESAARLKQALGTLRGAQAAYEKTIVRSPISGSVNALYLRANEYVSQNTPAAVIANNNALEITTSISEEERGAVREGDEVVVNDTWRGTITDIAPAVDPLSGKIEVRLGVDEQDQGGSRLENGATVSIMLIPGNTEAITGPLRIPLKSLKITPQGPVAFTLSRDGTLEARPVTLGPITGDVVTVLDGIDARTLIVEDARGLKEGEHVTRD